MAHGVAGVSPTVSLAQSAQGSISQATETQNEAPQTDTTASSQMAHPADRHNLDSSADAEIDRRFNELRSELLDDRASTIEWWLGAVAVFLAFLAIFGLFGFREFRELKKEARTATEIAEKSANKARDIVREIEEKRDKADEFLGTMSAEKVAVDPDIAEQVEAVSKDPEASLLDRAIARAIFLQKDGETEGAIKIWKGIAYATEEIDIDRAANAWFSIGYLLSQAAEESITGDKVKFEEALGHYDQAIRLNPNLPGAYNNRGVTKCRLGRYQDAIADYGTAIRLRSDEAIYYDNRGRAKADLGRIAEARADFEKARDIAKQAGDAETVSTVEQNLRNIEGARNA